MLCAYAEKEHPWVRITYKNIQTGRSSITKINYIASRYGTITVQILFHLLLVYINDAIISFLGEKTNKMDTALYFFVLNKKLYVALRNCLARCSAAGGQLESVKYVAYHIILHSFEIGAFLCHLILHISLTFHR